MTDIDKMSKDELLDLQLDSRIKTVKTYYSSDISLLFLCVFVEYYVNLWYNAPASEFVINNLNN